MGRRRKHRDPSFNARRGSCTNWGNASEFAWIQFRERKVVGSGSDGGCGVSEWGQNGDHEGWHKNPNVIAGK